MRNYRKAKPGEVKCTDCEYGCKPDEPGRWHQCRYFVRGISGGHEVAVSKNGTCNCAKRATKENP